MARLLSEATINATAALGHDGVRFDEDVLPALVAHDPAVVSHAITSAVPLGELHRAAVLTDGAARLVDAFGLLSWAELLDLLSTAGPEELLRRTRAAEECDPAGIRWPRNKKSDDATAVYRAPNVTPRTHLK